MYSYFNQFSSIVFFFLNRPFEVELLQVKNNIIAYRICDVDQIFLISILFPNK